ncbi:hypothetical protein CANINC_003567 [Pichia inconspicua]|uniref:Uncharacterized protein n=1 Tax=Pichia inconspicua TaxID=52247 RepID=A0A4T0WYB0_9ASCO|nr:hypothetical protein CANINC_003567 [[Candida] inconspicua]
MSDVQSAVESAKQSVQSSIIKPRFRDEDIFFTTIKMYEEGEEVLNGITSATKYTPPGSNNMLFLRANYVMGLFYTCLRFLLTFYFTLYQYYLWIKSTYQDISGIVISNFWYALSYFPLPEDASIQGPAAMLKSTSVNSVNTQMKTSIWTTIFQEYYKLRLLPTRLGNLVQERSLATSIPRDRMSIRQATGRLYVPDHIVFTFEMNPLVVPQPPEVPVPFLDYEKRIVAPDKKEVASVLAKRAEWSSLHHTHKAAETFRVLYEAVKCIVWAACSGVRIVTVFESNGYAWKDMEKVCGMIKEELSSLTKSNTQVYDLIKVINLENLESLEVSFTEDKSNSGNDFEPQSFGHKSTLSATAFGEFNQSEKGDKKSDEETSFAQLEPSPNSIVSSVKIDENFNERGQIFRTSLTVFLLSSKNINCEQFHVERAKAEIVKQINGNTNIQSPHYPFYKGYFFEGSNYQDPDIIYKFCNLHSLPYSLSGYPLSTFMDYDFSSQPIFISSTKPANFPQFLKGLKALNSALKKDR